MRLPVLMIYGRDGSPHRRKKGRNTIEPKLIGEDIWASSHSLLSACDGLSPQHLGENIRSEWRQCPPASATPSGSLSPCSGDSPLCSCLSHLKLGRDGVQRSWRQGWWGPMGGASGSQCLPEGAAWGPGSVDARQVGRVGLCLDSQELSLRTSGDLEWS